MDDEDEDVCGWSFDHDLEVCAEGQEDGRGWTQSICRTCGAEFVEDDETGDSLL